MLMLNSKYKQLKQAFKDSGFTDKALRFVVKNKTKIKIAALALLVGAMLFRGIIQIPVIKSYEHEIEIVKENIMYEEAKQSEVDHLKEIEGSEEWYEKKARERGYIKDNEKVFYDISKQD